MLLEEDPLGVGHLVLTKEQSAAASETIAVEMVRGDELVQKRGLAVPTFLKMDVEGCELDVFQGMRDVLKDARCRGVFCEVHFRDAGGARTALRAQGDRDPARKQRTHFPALDRCLAHLGAAPRDALGRPRHPSPGSRRALPLRR